MDGQIHRKCQQMAHRGARAIVVAHRNSTQERERKGTCMSGSA
jgi:hypothetical protein